MDDRQTNRLAMYRNLLSMMGLPANKTIFDTLATIETRRIAFKDIVDDIEDQSLIQGRDTKGATAAKKQVEAQLEKLAHKASENLLVFAEDSGNTKLATTYNVSISDIKGLRDEKLVEASTNILADAKIHAAGIAALKFSAANLASLESLIIAYKESLSDNPNLQAMRTAATAALLLLFPDAATAVEKLTKGVNLLKDDHPDTVALFEKTKNIKDLGS